MKIFPGAVLKIRNNEFQPRRHREHRAVVWISGFEASTSVFSESLCGEDSTIQ
jgi:hypothetical protein